MQILPFPSAQPAPVTLPPDRDDERLTEILDRVRSLDPRVGLKRIEFARAADEFMRDHVVTLRSPKTVESQLRVLRPYLVGLMVDEIDVAVLQKLIAARLAAGVTKGTINRN